MGVVAPLPVFIAVGLAVGVLYGLFGAGGSAFATPVLAMLGVPPVLALASPLPATIPAAMAGAWSYARKGHLAGPLARRAVLFGVPAAAAGALASRYVSGPVLLLLSGAVVVVLGARMVLPARSGERGRRFSSPSSARSAVVSIGAAGVGLATGLLANGGGFLLVPLFVLVVGLGMRAAAGTSLVVAAALSVPTLLTHWALGHIDWPLALVFAIGLIPGSLIGSRLSGKLPPAMAQRAFGVVLMAFGLWFVAQRVR